MINPGLKKRTVHHSRLDGNIRHAHQNRIAEVVNSNQTSNQGLVVQTQNAFCRVQEVTRMIKGMKANHVGVQHPSQNIFTALQLSEDLRGWEGNVQKKNLATRSRRLLVETTRQETQVVVMDP